MLLCLICGCNDPAEKLLRVDLVSEAPQPEAVLVSQCDDWPNLFGPSHDCSATQQLCHYWGHDGPPQRWQMKIGTGYSSPVVASNRVIQLHRLGNEEVVSCIDASSGQVLWEYRYPTKFECKSNYTNGPYGTPSIAENILLSLGAEGMLHALELTTGKLLWVRNLKEEFGVEQRIFGVGHSPLIDGQNVYVNVGGTARESGLVCFDLATGVMRWATGKALDGYGTPRILHAANRTLVIVLAYDKALAVDRQSGQLVWEYSQPIKISDAENAVTPVIDGELALFSSYGNGSSCFRFRADGQVELLWEDRKILTSQFNPIICRDGYAYGFHCSDHSLRCIEMESGELQWRTKVKFTRANIVTVGTHAIFLDDHGHLVSGELTTEGFRMIAKSDSYSGDKFCFASPAVSGRCLYLKTEEQLYCLDLGPELNSEEFPSMEAALREQFGDMNTK